MCIRVPLLAALIVVSCAPPEPSSGGRAGGTDGSTDEGTHLNVDATGPTVTLRIPAEGEGYVIGRVGTVLHTPDALIVLDQASPFLHLFRHDGSWLRSFGRLGSGPGEFRAPRTIGVNRYGLWVNDLGLSRLSLLDPESGEFRSSRALPGLPTTAVLLPDSSVVLAAERPLRAGSSDRKRTFTMWLLNRARLDTVFSMDFPDRVLDIPTGNGSITGPQPFDDDPLFRIGTHDGHLVIVHRTVTAGARSFRVRRISPRGAEVFTRDYPYDPVPIRGDMIERAIDGRSRSAGSDARAMAERVRQALFLPPHQPPVQRVLIGDDGRIWLQREEKSDTVPPEWMILSPSGVEIGFVPMPVGFVPTSMTGNRALGLRSDPAGRQFIEIVEFPTLAGSTDR
jgi:hypothetical protein